MRLRRLTLFGFKTFARRGEIVFDAGITAVVGPNGSGKSNIVDAVRWALGETNARELRGGRMDEVIFSGGNGRGRMGVAEVELVLDNENNELPIEGSEVAVGRRVTRGGDSEYRLNGTRVRLRDVESVLDTTGLTQSGYAVVAQNDIDSIIQATPEQRRALVEQAAGVRILRASAEDALGRVHGANDKVERLTDLLDDAAPRLNELSGQAVVAREQRDLTERLASLRGSLGREAWRAARGQLRQAKRRVDAANAREQDASATERIFAERTAEAKASLEVVRERHQKALTALEQARVAAEHASGESRRFADRQATAALHRAATSIAVATATQERDDATRELHEVMGTEAAIRSEWNTLEAELSKQRDACERSSQAALDAAERVERCEQTWARCEAARVAAVASDRDTAARAAFLDSTLRSLEEDLVGLRERVAAAEIEHGEAEEAARRAISDNDSARERSEQAHREVAAARVVHTDAEASYAAAHQAAQKARARVAALRGRIDGALGSTGAVARAIEAGTLVGRRLVDCFTVRDPLDRPVVEAALEAHLGAWLVEDLHAAQQVIAGAAVREELLVAGSVVAESAVTVVNSRAAIDLIDIDSDARGALQHCLSRVFVAESADAAADVVAHGGVAILRDGTVVTAAGIRGGGTSGQTLELAQEEHDAARAADHEGVRESAMLHQLEAVAVAMSDAEAAARDAYAIERSSAEAMAHAKAVVASSTVTVQAIAQQLQTIEATISEQRSEHAVCTAALRVTHEDVARTQRAADEGSAQLEKDRAEARELADKANTDTALLQEAQGAAFEKRFIADDSERRVSALRQAIDMAHARVESAELRCWATEVDVMSALVHGRYARGILGRALISVDEAHGRVALTAPELAESEGQLARLDADRADIAIAAARARDEAEAAHLDYESANALVLERAEAIREDGDDDEQELDPSAMEKAEREIVRIERRIVALGPVNALAPEQHQLLSTHVEALQESKRDLADACDDVTALAEQLNTAAAQRFDTVFSTVSDCFQSLFAELFPGGVASLRLQEPVRPIEGDDENAARPPAPAGVEILAQPAGKRLQPLSLLSGGERSLTALAMVLALQQVNASPFYIFDEVDAPLDDSNVVRFVTLLTRLAETQQFIVVTHNHVTMSAASALYGVTMNADGTSEILSVRFVHEAGADEGTAVVRGTKQPVLRAVV